jgi:Protein kinase domain
MSCEYDSGILVPCSHHCMQHCPAFVVRAVNPICPACFTRVSRYEMEFIEQERLGKGGFGIVVAAINRIDGRRYAVKKIPMTGHDIGFNTLREVSTLSGLHHGHIVRYYQAWREHVDHKVDDSASADESGAFLFRHTSAPSDSIPTAGSTSRASGLGQHVRSTTMWSLDSDAQVDGRGHVANQSGVLDTVREASQDLGSTSSQRIPLPPGTLEGGSASGTQRGVAGTATVPSVGTSKPQDDSFDADTASDPGVDSSRELVGKRGGIQGGMRNRCSDQFASDTFHDGIDTDDDIEEEDAAAPRSPSSSEGFSGSTSSSGSKNDGGNSAFTFAHSQARLRETSESVVTSCPPAKVVCISPVTCLLVSLLVLRL